MKWLVGAVVMLLCDVVACEADPKASTVVESAMKKAAARQEAAGDKLGKPVEITNSIGMKLRLIPSGEFVMGNSKSPEELMRVYELVPSGEFVIDSSKSSEDIIRAYDLLKIFLGRPFKEMQPQHRVQITEPFYLGQTEVTQGQWEAVMETRPWEGKSLCKEGSEYAASFVSWEDAVDFCKKLGRMEGETYRLPTEAEWEYACRADTTTLYSFGDDWSDLADYAWFDGNADGVGEKYAHEVKKKLPNGFGLHDMHGNMWEWCSDWYGRYDHARTSDENPSGPASGSCRVIRGGSWNNPACVCQSSFRFGLSPTFRRSNPGFRVVRQAR